MRRYKRDQRISGGLLQTAQSVTILRRAKEFKLISLKKVILSDSQRLDHIAYKHLGDPHAWWIIAALSDKGGECSFHLGPSCIFLGTFKQFNLWWGNEHKYNFS